MTTAIYIIFIATILLSCLLSGLIGREIGLKSVVKWNDSSVIPSNDRDLLVCDKYGNFAIGFYSRPFGSYLVRGSVKTIVDKWTELPKLYDED